MSTDIASLNKQTAGNTTLPAAKLHVLQLEPIKEKIGDRWPRMSLLVHSLFEKALRHAQGPQDHFIEGRGAFLCRDLPWQHPRGSGDCLRRHRARGLRASVRRRRGNRVGTQRGRRGHPGAACRELRGGCRIPRTERPRKCGDEELGGDDTGPGPDRGGREDPWTRGDRSPRVYRAAGPQAVLFPALGSEEAREQRAHPQSGGACRQEWVRAAQHPWQRGRAARPGWNSCQTRTQAAEGRRGICPAGARLAQGLRRGHGRQLRHAVVLFRPGALHHDPEGNPHLARLSAAAENRGHSAGRASGPAGRDHEHGHRPECAFPARIHRPDSGVRFPDGRRGHWRGAARRLRGMAGREPS